MKKLLLFSAIALILVLTLVACDIGPTPTASPLSMESGKVVVPAGATSDPEPPSGDIESLNGFSIGVIIVGVVGLIQQLFNTDEKQPIKGRVTIVIALLTGLFLYGISGAIKYGLLATDAQLWVALVTEVLMATLSVPGLFSVMENTILPAIGRTKLSPVRDYPDYPAKIVIGTPPAA